MTAIAPTNDAFVQNATWQIQLIEREASTELIIKRADVAEDKNKKAKKQLARLINEIVIVTGQSISREVSTPATLQERRINIPTKLSERQKQSLKEGLMNALNESPYDGLDGVLKIGVATIALCAATELLSARL